MPDRFHPPIVPVPPTRVRRGRDDGAPPVWWVGVDGGGTGTRVALARGDGTVLGRGEAGASALGQGVQTAWTRISEALARACEAAGVSRPHWPACALGAGLSGVNVPELAEAFCAAAPAGLGGLALDSDGFAALLGAHAGGPGVLVIAGTGSVAEALHADGRRVRAGGWGWQSGDEGSGAWLGREALRHAQRVVDGREVGATLAQAVVEAAEPQGGLQHFAIGAGQAAYAALAPRVFEAAAAGDAYAESLLARAAVELEALIAAVDADAALPVALGGSIAARLAPRLAPRVQARLHTPRADAATGALWLARRALGAAVTS